MAAAGGGATSLWWDMESCPLPSYVDPYIVASMASALLRNFNIITSMVNAGGDGSSLDHYQFSAYECFSEIQTELHQTLINSEMQLHQLLPGKTRNEMEKMMMADILLWAMDTPAPANIICIVGSVDLCYVFQKLRQRSYNVFLVCQSMSEMPQGMLGGVNDCLGWLSFLRLLQNEYQQSHFRGGISVYDHTFSNTAFSASSTSIRNREMEESNNASYLNYSQENLFSLQPSLSGGWDSTYILPLDETVGSSQVQTEPNFHGHFISTEKLTSPVSSASPTENKGLGSLEEFKLWLARVVNSIEHAENGYSISHIRLDFEKATRKILNEKLLGFSKIKNLVEECKDIAVLKEVKQGCHFAFPLELGTQKNLVSSPGGVNRNPSPEFKPKAETDPKLKQKASAEDFREFIYHMLMAGEFSQGFLLGRLRHKFEEQTGKVLDVKHLGYKKLSNLIASYSHLLSVDNAESSRIFPSGFVSEAKVDADCPSSGGSGKDLLKNRVRGENIFNEQLHYMKSESEWLTSMTTGFRASGSFSPYRDSNSPFQEYHGIKLDSSSTPEGSQVSEREGQSSNTVSDTTSFPGELKGSDIAKQHVSTLQWDSNDPIEDSINAEFLMAEAMQNMSLMKENANLCVESTIHACTLGFPDWNTPPSESPISEPQGGCTSPLAEPLQSRSRAESSAFCVEDLRYGIRLDCKQNELNTQKNPVSSPDGVHQNPSPEFKPKEETNPKLKQKASAEDFREFINQMLLANEFSQGFELGSLRRKFEEQTGKVLDVKHLGYKKLSKLVASYSQLLLVDNGVTGFSRIFPAGFVSETVPSNSNSNTTSEVTSMNTNHDLAQLKETMEVGCPSSALSGKELLKNRAWEQNIFNKQLPYMNTESQWLPSMTTGPWASVNFSPYREEATGPAFHENNSIKSDSSSTPGGYEIREKKAQSSNTSSDMMSFHGELEGSDFIKQHVSTLRWENNDPIEDLINAECPMAESMQNMSLMKENANICGPSIHACTLEISDWNPPQSESPSSEPHAGCNSPLADPLQSRSRAESSVFCAEDLRYGIRLDCKQNELNTQENPMSSPGRVNRNPSSELKPEATTDPKIKLKASAEDFREFIYQMLLAGGFSEGFVLGRLCHKFEEQTGKVLDVKHLGHKKLSKLVASYSHLLSVENAGTEFSRIFPAGFVSKVAPSNPNSNPTSKLTSLNTNHDPTKLKAKVEADCPSSGVSGKESLENRAWDKNIHVQQFPYMHSESEWLPDMTGGSQAPASLIPKQANSPDFQECDIKSDSASTRGGFQVSEWEGQSSTTISETPFFHGEGSDCINLVLALQRDGNIAIEDSVIAKRLIVEAMEDRRPMIENTTFCREPSIPAGTGLPDSIPSAYDCPSSEPQVDCIGPHAPLQSKGESNAVCSEDSRDSIRLGCKQNEQNTKSGGNEGSIHMISAVPSAGSIIQVAGRGLKNICELAMWRKNR